MDLTEKSSDILKLSCLDLGHSYTQFQGEKKNYHITFNFIILIGALTKSTTDLYTKMQYML